MHYSLICFDKKNSYELRMKKRPLHLDYLKNNKKKILFAGPLLDEENNVKGSLIVINANTKSEVTKFYHKDPYFQSGLFEEIQIFKFKKVF